MENKKERHSHPLPYPDPNWCSCCRKAIGHSTGVADNVFTIKRSMETILDPETGEPCEKTKIVHNHVYMHDKCAEEHYAMRLICEKCGVWCMARNIPAEVGGEKKLIPIEEHCTCVCHKGKDYCALVTIYRADEKMHDQRRFKKWHQKRIEENT